MQAGRGSAAGTAGHPGKDAVRIQSAREAARGLADLGKLPRGDGFLSRLNKAEDQAAERTAFGETDGDPQSDLIVCLVIFLLCLSLFYVSFKTSESVRGLL